MPEETPKKAPEPKAEKKTTCAACGSSVSFPAGPDDETRKTLVDIREEIAKIRAQQDARKHRDEDEEEDEEEDFSDEERNLLGMDEEADEED